MSKLKKLYEALKDKDALRIKPNAPKWEDSNKCIFCKEPINSNRYVIGAMVQLAEFVPGKMGRVIAPLCIHNHCSLNPLFEEFVGYYIYIKDTKTDDLVLVNLAEFRKVYRTLYKKSHHKAPIKWDDETIIIGSQSINGMTIPVHSKIKNVNTGTVDNRTTYGIFSKRRKNKAIVHTVPKPAPKPVPRVLKIYPIKP